MENQHDQQLEAFVRNQLRALPSCKAPATLAPRVMAAIKARAFLPWYKRSFWAWPAGAQAGFLALMVVGIVCLYPALQAVCELTGHSAWMRHLEEYVALLKSCCAVLSDLEEALILVLRKGMNPVLMTVTAFTICMYLCCIGAGTMLLRVMHKR